MAEAQWVLTLLDKIPLTPAEKLDALKKKFLDLGKESEKNEKQLGSMFKGAIAATGLSIAVWEKGIEVLERMAEAGIELDEKLAESLIDVGLEALKAGDSARSASIGLGYMLGSTEKGNEALEEANRLTRVLGDSHPLEWFKELSVAQYPAAAIRDVTLAALDLSKLKPEYGPALVSSITRIGELNEASSRTLNMLAHSGVAVEHVYEALAKKTGRSIDDIKEHGVDAATAVPIILASVVEKTGAPLGKVAREVGEGWEGAQVKLKAGWDQFLEHVNESPGFLALTRTLGKLGDMIAHFDPKPLIDAFTMVGWGAIKALEMIQAMTGMSGKGTAALHAQLEEGGGGGWLASKLLPDFVLKALAGAEGVPKLAGGGTVDKPTLAMIGEQGTEHVIRDVDFREMGGRGVNVSVTFGDIIVHAGGGGAEEIRQMVREALDEVPERIISAFERSGAMG